MQQDDNYHGTAAVGVGCTVCTYFTLSMQESTTGTLNHDWAHTHTLHHIVAMARRYKMPEGCSTWRTWRRRCVKGSGKDLPWAKVWPVRCRVGLHPWNAGKRAFIIACWAPVWVLILHFARHEGAINLVIDPARQESPVLQTLCHTILIFLLTRSHIKVFINKFFFRGSHPPHPTCVHCVHLISLHQIGVASLLLCFFFFVHLHSSPAASRLTFLNSLSPDAWSIMSTGPSCKNAQLNVSK